MNRLIVKTIYYTEWWREATRRIERRGNDTRERKEENEMSIRDGREEQREEARRDHMRREEEKEKESNRKKQREAK